MCADSINKTHLKNNHSSSCEDTEDYLSLFLSDTPLMDVRAPVEFSEGAFPAARNIPLLDDKQRELIGTRYKKAGQDAAIELGEELATPELRQQRLSLWSGFCSRHPEGYLYCFRGGLRSHITQQWLRENDIHYPLVKGGYKALRRFLLQQFEYNVGKTPLLLLSGPTGSGKTRLLVKLKRAIDLEGLAKHRGSAFGGLPEPQPAQIDWENAVSIALLKHVHKLSAQHPVVLEDEGRLIGRIFLPQFLQQQMREAPLVLLRIPMDELVHMTNEDYVTVLWPHYQELYGGEAEEKFTTFVLHNLQRIRKRLGGERHDLVHRQFSHGLSALFQGKDEAFSAGIRELLTFYYDPLYDYQLQKRQGKILFEGDHPAVLSWLNDYTGRAV